MELALFARRYGKLDSWDVTRAVPKFSLAMHAAEDDWQKLHRAENIMRNSDNAEVDNSWCKNGRNIQRIWRTRLAIKLL